MRFDPRRLLVAVAIGALVVIPLLLLEAVTTRGFSTYGFPTALFAVLWVLASAFMGLFLNLLKNVKNGSGLRLSLAASAILMLVIATVWGRLVVDQMPCFMGVPNCD